MEPEQDVEQKTNSSSTERELDRDKVIFVNKDQGPFLKDSKNTLRELLI